MTENVKNYKIKHLFVGPVEISGVANIFKKSFDKFKIKNTQLTFKDHPFHYSSDKCLNISNKPRIVAVFLLLTNFIKSIFLYDSFFFIFGNSLLPWNLDLPILKILRKKTIMMFCGCDIRCRELILKEKRKYSACKECQIECDLKVKKRKANWIQKYIDVIFSQPEYSQLISKYQYIYVPIDLKEWKVNFINNEIPVIIHAPTDGKIKGTKYVLRAIEKLKKENYKFKFVLLEKISNKEIKKQIENCDIVVDQLLLGWHGIFAIEAMAVGKPTLCHIREDLRKRSLEIPILSTNPNNIYDNLKLLIENPELRLELGKKGRQYVEKYHDAERVAQKILKTFKEIR